jgi:hypothetical protein
MRILLLLLAGHAICDYPLQGEFLAKGKNINTPIPGMGWQQLMLAHCLIHCGMVLLITGSVWMALAELVIHFITDTLKCEGVINFNQDQAVHYGCKVLWAFLIWRGNS